METAPAYDNKGKYIPTGQRALVGQSSEIMAKAAAFDVDPRLIVAIGFLEGKWGGGSGTASAHNSWGLLTSRGSLIALVTYTRRSSRKLDLKKQIIPLLREAIAGKPDCPLFDEIRLGFPRLDRAAPFAE